MPHFDIPNGSHSVSNGTLFVWNTTDGPGQTSHYKFQVGTKPGYYNKFNGNWKAGSAAGQWTDNVNNLPGNGVALYVRALYR